MSAADPTSDPGIFPGRWKILIADEAEAVHRSAVEALNPLRVRRRPFDFLHAYSGEQARGLVEDHPDIALILLDRELEARSPNSSIIALLRRELGNQQTRIILQCGRAFEVAHDKLDSDAELVVQKYEMTQRKLRLMVFAAVSAYRDLLAQQAALERLAELFAWPQALARGVSRQQLAAEALDWLLRLCGERDTELVDGFVAFAQGEELEAVPLGDEGHRLRAVWTPREMRARLEPVKVNGRPYYDGEAITLSCPLPGGRLCFHLVFAAAPARIDEPLIDGFCRAVGLADELRGLRAGPVTPPDAVRPTG